MMWHRSSLSVLVICVLVMHCMAQSTDPQRPMYHFLPEKNWMNDPNGMMYFNGFYHLFYQYNPTAAINEPQYNVWGHAVSKNLVNWQYLPFALVPTPNSYDMNGCWSGSATIVNGVPTIFYTGINYLGVNNLSYSEVQCTATPSDLSDPLLTNWTKTTSNPLIPQAPSNLQVYGIRDPTTAWQSPNGSVWYLEVGSGGANGGFTLLYQSTDFLHWTYVHEFFNASLMFAGNMFECPDFYSVSEQVHVFKASIGGWTGHDFWLTGTYDTEKLVFVPFDNKEGWFDFGKFYASKSFHDPVQGRQVLFGWSDEDDSVNSYVARGWAGVQTLPRQIILNSDSTISNFPVAEVQTLRGTNYNFPNLVVNDQEISLNLTQGDQIELSVDIKEINGTPYRFGLKVRASPDNKEYTLIYFSPSTPYLLNEDLPGNDFKGVAIDAQDPGLCDEMCTSNEQCFSWSYAPPGDQGPSPMCFMKFGVPTITPKQGTISGIKGLLNIDRSNSSLATDANAALQIAPLSSLPSSMSVFIDHSIIEVFVNGGRTNMVSRIYPTLTNSEGVSFFVEGGTVTADINVWEINSIW